MAQTAPLSGGISDLPSTPLTNDIGHDLRSTSIQAFREVRAETERRAAPLSAEDQVVQSMPDASPTKWHRAHTTWFFEQFLLVPHADGYQPFDERFAFLFNSYYVAAGPRHARPKRGLITRPSLAEVAAYRAHVDAAVETLIGDVAPARLREVLRILEIGLNHEQQHQELILTDILHALAENPDCPAYDPAWRLPRTGSEGDGRLRRHSGGHPHHRPPGQELLLRQRAAGASRAGRAGRDRARARHQCAVAGVHRGRRLRAARAVALRRLGDRAAGRLGRAGLLAQPRRRLVDHVARRPACRSIRRCRSPT